MFIVYLIKTLRTVNTTVPLAGRRKFYNISFNVGVLFYVKEHSSNDSPNTCNAVLRQDTNRLLREDKIYGTGMTTSDCHIYVLIV